MITSRSTNVRVNT